LVYKNVWINIQKEVSIQKILKFNVNYVGLVKMLHGGINYTNNFLIFNFKKNLKISFNSFGHNNSWVTSIGVILKILKLGLKSERKLEKNKTLFVNYIFKYILVGVRVISLLCKYFSLNFLIFLKKLNFFKKVKLINIIFLIKLSPFFKKRVKRIKRRLKKRILKSNSF
jgi:hypothetical protein